MSVWVLRLRRGAPASPPSGGFLRRSASPWLTTSVQSGRSVAGPRACEARFSLCRDRFPAQRLLASAAFSPAAANAARSRLFDLGPVFPLSRAGFLTASRWAAVYPPGHEARASWCSRLTRARIGAALVGAITRGNRRFPHFPQCRARLDAALGRERVAPQLGQALSGRSSGRISRAVGPYLAKSPPFAGAPPDGCWPDRPGAPRQTFRLILATCGSSMPMWAWGRPPLPGSLSYQAVPAGRSARQASPPRRPIRPGGSRGQPSRRQGSPIAGGRHPPSPSWEPRHLRASVAWPAGSLFHKPALFDRPSCCRLGLRRSSARQRPVSAPASLRACRSPALVSAPALTTCRPASALSCPTTSHPSAVIPARFKKKRGEKGIPPRLGTALHPSPLGPAVSASGAFCSCPPSFRSGRGMAGGDNAA